MERDLTYLLSLDGAAVVSTLIVLFFAALDVREVFVIATEIIFILLLASLFATFLYYLKLGDNEWLFIPSLIVVALGGTLTFMDWFIGGLVAMIGLFLLIISKNRDSKVMKSIIPIFAGFSVLAITPPLEAYLSMSFTTVDYGILGAAIALIILGLYLYLKTEQKTENLHIGLLLLALSFMFIAPAHELFGIHGNMAYGVYDTIIVIFSTIGFFVFMANLIMVELKKDSISKSISKAYSLISEKKYAEAASLFKKIYKSLPDDDRVLNGLALALMKAGNYKESEPYFKRLVRLYGDNDVYLTNYGNLYFRMGNIDKAMEIYNQVLSKNPNCYNAINNLARCYMEKGEYEKARELLEKAIKIDPDKKAAKLNYYFLLTSLGMQDEAVKLKAELGELVS